MAQTKGLYQPNVLAADTLTGDKVGRMEHVLDK